MKKRIAALVFLVGLSIAGHTQSLKYSLWLGTKPPSPNLWFRFGSDTLSYSTNGAAYTALSIFGSGSGQFFIYDLSGSALCTDTGFYSFVQNGNNLVYTLISDNCVSRRNTILNYTWTGLNLGVTEANPLPDFSITQQVNDAGKYTVRYPNLKGNALVEIFDLSGKMVYQEELYSVNTTLDLSTLFSGLYIGKCASEKTTKTFKLIR